MNDNHNFANNNYLCISLNILYPDNMGYNHKKYIIDLMTLLFTESRIYCNDPWGEHYQTEPKITDTIPRLAKRLKWTESKLKRVLKYCKKMNWIRTEKKICGHGNNIVISRNVVLLLKKMDKIKK